MRGFRGANPLVLVAALVLAALVLAGTQYFFTSGMWSAVPLRVWLRADRATASGTYVSWTIANLRTDPPELPMVYLLGGSAAREATIDNGDSLAATIRELSGQGVQAQNLATPVQTFAQGLAIVDSLPDATPTTILIGVSPGRFTSGAFARSRQSPANGLLVWGATLQSYLDRESIDQSVMPPIVDVAQNLVATVRADARGLWRGRLPRTRYVQHRWDSAAIKSDAVMQKRAQAWVENVAPRFDANVEGNLAMLEELIRRAQERGFDVVIVELPRNLEVIGDRWDDLDARYQPATRKIAEEHGVVYLDFNREVAAPSDAFFDTHHMRRAGRVVWEKRLAQEMARLYRSGAIRAPNE